jgi:2-polyprenyl-3-methyl-5-hydroxy-6-metoxy-1,4-benzoquinol methylase
LLDIGCGTGEFLNACKENGWNITGIEPSEIARKKAEQKHNITPLSQEKLFEINEKKFNVITLWHVLEHIYQLDKTIEQIGKIISDEGVLIVAVPNCNSYDAKKYSSFWAAWDLPRHIYHFTERDIKTLFNKYGFRLTEVFPMKFDSYYVSLLSEKYKNRSSNLISGFWNGLISNSSAKINERGFSSQIYILKMN